MVDFLLNDGLNNFIRGDFLRICLHPQMVEIKDAVFMLQRKYLQLTCRDQRDGHNSFNRIHGVCDQFLASVSYVLQVSLNKCLVQIVRPGFGPEIVIKSTNDMSVHFDSDLYFTQAGVQFDYFFRRHVQVGTDQDGFTGTVFNQHKSELFLDRLSSEVEAKDIKFLDLAVGSDIDGREVVNSSRDKFLKFYLSVVSGRSIMAILGLRLFFTGNDVVYRAGDIWSRRCPVFPRNVLAIAKARLTTAKQASKTTMHGSFSFPAIFLARFAVNYCIKAINYVLQKTF